MKKKMCKRKAYCPGKIPKQNRRFHCPQGTNDNCEIITKEKEVVKGCTCGYEKFFHNFADRLHTALQPAIKVWRKENNAPLTLPDTVGFVKWLVAYKLADTKGNT
jgi:hypothetical protein